jgi:hypothetical protein
MGTPWSSYASGDVWWGNGEGGWVEGEGDERRGKKGSRAGVGGRVCLCGANDGRRHCAPAHFDHHSCLALYVPTKFSPSQIVCVSVQQRHHCPYSTSLLSHLNYPGTTAPTVLTYYPTRSFWRPCYTPRHSYGEDGNSDCPKQPEGCH